ncbi:MAG: zinc-finger domain-containing protein [Gammaproteobacteria bacterium]
MTETASTSASAPQTPPRGRQRYEITRDQLPLHCPLDDTRLWNAHPRVFLPIEETGEATFPYCGTEYVLKD